MAERNTTDWYRNFGELEARGQSPIFEAWALGISDDADVIALIDELPLQKRQPNLVFASARLAGAPLAGYPEFRGWLLENWPAVAREAAERMTQTNEPRRCAALLPALGLIAEASDRPIALLELGASAGLCLYPDHYSYRFGNAAWLHPDAGASTVRIETEAAGPIPVPGAMPRIAWRAGVDVHPLDVRDPADVEWLETLVWPEQNERLERIREAIEIVRADPPTLIRGSAIDELGPAARAAQSDATLVIVTSAMLVYVPYLERMRLVDDIRALNASWISLDGIGVLPDVDARHPHPQPGQFTLSLDGEPLAEVGPHGQFVNWFVHPAGTPQ
ncbi:MAG: DUF2332 domain-containing protein [Cryobacterium sp.]|nr:DUF2332 domain-containing protein [Cryobacterium sp.]